jgi:hypothetical protein
MKPHAIKNVVAILFLLMAVAILAVGCYVGGPPPPEYPDYGYYEGYYPGFFETDVIIDVDRHREDFDRRHERAHMPARRIPPSAPRPMPHPHPEHIRR